MIEIKNYYANQKVLSLFVLKNTTGINIIEKKNIELKKEIENRKNELSLQYE